MKWVDFTTTMDYSFAGRAKLTYTVGDSKTNDFLTESTENRAGSSSVSLLVLWEGVGGGEQHGDGEEGLD